VVVTLHTLKKMDVFKNVEVCRILLGLSNAKEYDGLGI
jgi:hypothetical protein